MSDLQHLSMFDLYHPIPMDSNNKRLLLLATQIQSLDKHIGNFAKSLGQCSEDNGMYISYHHCASTGFLKKLFIPHP